MEKSSVFQGQSIDYGCCRAAGMHSFVAMLLVGVNARATVTFDALGDMIHMTWLRGLLLEGIFFLAEIRSTSLWNEV